MTHPLRIDGIGKAFGGTRALDGVSLAVAAGTVHGLVGENGAGKSTLIKVVSGVLSPDEGRILVAGRPARFRTVRDAQEAGIATLHQELSLVGSLDAAENILLDRPPTRGLGLVDWRALRHRAREALAGLGVDLPVDVPVAQLSPAMQTMVAIARALRRDARVLVLDEPTAALTDRETAQLFAVLRRLRSRGVAVVYVSHRLEEVTALTDVVTVMRDGRVVTTQPTAELDENHLVQLMVGRRAGSLYPPRAGPPGPDVLRAEGLTGHRVGPVSLVVHAGEVVGVAGLGGSGRSELLRLLAGSQRRRAGTVLLHGRPVAPTSPKQARRLGIALLPEERRTQGLVLRDSVADNLAVPALGRVALGGVLVTRGRHRAHARRLVEELQVKVAHLGQPVGELSGGNQQKVVFGRCLARAPQLLLLDEPSRGIDVGTKAEIYRLIRRIASGGAAVLMVSSDLPELLGLSDRVVALHEGRHVATVRAAETDEHALLAHLYGKAAA